MIFYAPVDIFESETLIGRIVFDRGIFNGQKELSVHIEICSDLLQMLFLNASNLVLCVSMWAL